MSPLDNLSYLSVALQILFVILVVLFTIRSRSKTKTIPSNVTHTHTWTIFRAASTIGIVSVLAASGWLMRMLGGVGVDGNCGKLTFGRPELDWFLAHFVPLAIVMGLVSLLVNIAGSYYMTLRSADKPR